MQQQTSLIILNRHKVIFSMFFVYPCDMPQILLLSICFLANAILLAFSKMTLPKWDDSLYDKSLVSQMCMLILPKEYEIVARWALSYSFSPFQLLYFLPSWVQMVYLSQIIRHICIPFQPRIFLCRGHETKVYALFLMREQYLPCDTTISVASSLSCIE